MGTRLFKDLLVYRLTEPVAMFHHLNHDELNELLEGKKTREPGSQELGTFGFMEPVHEEGSYVERLHNGALLITAQAWKRDLPAAVVNRELAKKVRRIEDEENRKIFGKERRQLKDEVIMSLLPRAFVKGKRVSALIQHPFVYIDTSSAKLAENLLSLLREVLGSLPVRPVTMKTSPITSMTDWLRTADLSADTEEFTLGESFTANAANEEASTLSGKRVDLTEADIRQLLECGRQVTQLELGFQSEDDPDRIYFTLTEDLSIKGIQWPDSLTEQANQDAGDEAEAITLYRATLLLISDAVGRLFEGLVDALGGEDAVTPVDFDERLTKAAKAIGKDTKSFQLGDTNLATDFNLAALEEADREEAEDDEREPCPDGEHTYLGNSTTGAITAKCVDCGHDRTADDEVTTEFPVIGMSHHIVDDNEDLI